MSPILHCKLENDNNKKSIKFQEDMLIFYDLIQVFVFTKNYHLKLIIISEFLGSEKVRVSVCLCVFNN